MSTSLGSDPNQPSTTGTTPPALPSFAVGLVVGAVILGLVWTGSALVGGDDSPASNEPVTPASSLVSGSSESPAPAAPKVVRRTRVERCAAAAARLDEVLMSAAPAMGQWRVHVGAMNKLVLGEITLRQATDFWDRTRVGAQRRLASFAEAGQPVERRGLDCPTPQRLGRATTGVRACAARVSADERAWLAGRRALETWAEHVEDMDMLKMGHLSPQDATQMWLKSWEKGVREIDAYRGEVANAKRVGPC